MAHGFRPVSPDGRCRTVLRTHRRRHNSTHLYRVCPEAKRCKASKAALARQPRRAKVSRLDTPEGGEPEAQGKGTSILRQDLPGVRVAPTRGRQMEAGLLYSRCRRGLVAVSAGRLHG